MNAKKLAEAIDALFDQIEPATTEEEIDAELREAGYDPDEVAEQFRKVVADALARSPYNPQNDICPVCGGTGWVQEGWGEYNIDGIPCARCELEE